MNLPLWNVMDFLGTPSKNVLPVVAQTPLGDLVSTADGSLTIRHPGLEETYHSSAGAETEARQLYIEASGIRADLERGRPLKVLDVGLGLFYNAMATVDAWVGAAQPADLELVSLEYEPALIDAVIRKQAPWIEGWSNHRLSALSSLKEVEPQVLRCVLPHPTGCSQLTWTILVGDAHLTLKDAGAGFHYIWQDPFSPQKNPEMWSRVWFGPLKEAAAQGAVLMSYSVARTVRDALDASGWDAERIKTSVTHKKHWLRATLS